jgi:DNA-binding HxlR family transcriptional regulator/putative sterol carrier protein
MHQKQYNQFCALAFALDMVGERWTLLIIRELLIGPRRFKDLIEGLPDISTNLLSERLKTLEQHGLICRRTLPPPAGSTVYELTPLGRALQPAMVELGRWGSCMLPPTLEGVELPSMAAAALAIQAFFRPERAQGLRETYELHIGGEVLQVRVEAGRLRAQQAPAAPADAEFHTDMTTYMRLFAGQLNPDDALAQGLIRVEGDEAALGRFLGMCGVLPRGAERQPI